MGRSLTWKGASKRKIVALCDLDHKYAAKVFDTYPAARRYHDYREMFDKEARNFDALIIAVPDHMHAILLMAAIEMNEHFLIIQTDRALDWRGPESAAGAAGGNKRIVTKGSIQ